MNDRQAQLKSIPRRKIIFAVSVGVCMLTVASVRAGSTPSGNESCPA